MVWYSGKHVYLKFTLVPVTSAANISSRFIVINVCRCQGCAKHPLLFAGFRAKRMYIESSRLCSWLHERNNVACCELLGTFDGCIFEANGLALFCTAAPLDNDACVYYCTEQKAPKRKKRGGALVLGKPAFCSSSIKITRRRVVVFPDLLVVDSQLFRLWSSKMSERRRGSFSLSSESHWKDLDTFGLQELLYSYFLIYWRICRLILNLPDIYLRDIFPLVIRTSEIYLISPLGSN